MHFLILKGFACRMESFLYYLKFVAVLVAALLLGRWFDQERKRLKAEGQSGNKAWLTTPGILILIALALLAAFRIYLAHEAGVPQVPMD